jgi:integrase
MNITSKIVALSSAVAFALQIALALLMLRYFSPEEVGMFSVISQIGFFWTTLSLAQTPLRLLANHGVSVFEDARRDGFIAENPARDCGMLKKQAGTARRPFTVAELQTILAAADDEWRSMIFFGLYTGQRLGDIARLNWQNVDLVSGEICITTAKTGRLVRIPIVSPLLAHLEKLPSVSCGQTE